MKIFFRFPFFLICIISIKSIFAYEGGNIEDLPYPYNTVSTVLPYNGWGHFGPRQKELLTRLMDRYKPKVVLEVGSYLGASTRFVAGRLPNGGKVYAVDHWLGSEEWHSHPGFKEEQSLLYTQFLSNIIHKNLCDKVIPMKMMSLEAAQIFTDKPDLIFLDGAHDFESVYADICAWYHFVKDGGVLCGDDYLWGEGYPVKRAVDKFASEHNLRVRVIKNWCWFYEKK